MAKFGRKYKLFIETQDEQGEIQTLEIANPMSIKFTIDKSLTSQVNGLDLKIYNLAPNTRKLLIQDKFNILDFGSGKRYRRVILKAGYGINVPTIFVGSITEAYSFRQGVDVITQIMAFDGLYGMANSFSSLTLNGGISKNEMLNYLIQDLNKIEKGIITNINGELSRGALLNENTYFLIKENFRDYVSVNNGKQVITSRDIFINDEKLNILNKNDYIDVGYVMEISSDTGLLNVPIRRETYLEIDILFDPNIIVGQMIEVKSTFNKYFNGLYKVYGVRHDVEITEESGGDAITSLQLWIGTKILNGLKQV